MRLVLALGTNLGNRLANIERASLQLKFLKNMQHTSIIETKALLLPNSPPEWNKAFLNMIVFGESDMEPIEILKEIKIIEKKMGRNDDAPRWSPRIIDIDILTYGNLSYSDEHLIIPHNEIRNRDFWQRLLKEI